MRGLLRIAAAAALALAGSAWGLPLAGSAWGQARPLPSPDSVSLADTSALARRYVADGTVPGMVVLVGFGDNPPMLVAEGRQADGADAAPVGIDTLWRVYSMTKPITAVAAMMLVEEGRIGLDQPISDFIPAFARMAVLVDPAKGLETRPATRPITVRHLLTHSAGLGYSIITKGPLLDLYNRLGLNPLAVNAAMEAQLAPARPTSLAAFADRVATAPLIAEPGAKWSYSISLDVLARVVEVAGGMPFERFVQTRLFDPLKMRSSYWTVPAAEAGRLATNYAMFGGARIVADPGQGSLWLKPPAFAYGGAGLVMSAGDYDRFLRMLVNGGTLDGVRVLKAETVRLAMSDLLPAGTDRTLLTEMSNNGAPMGFGAGGSVYLADKAGGPSRGSYGWGGAAGTIAYVDPARRMRVTVMVNLFGETSLRPESTAAIYADLNR
jgi:CubicO group peptidase (beta-lactamase class C family)